MSVPAASRPLGRAGTGCRGRWAAVAAALAGLAVLASCGYRLAGRADLLPARIRTIAVPAFANATSEFKIEQHLTQAVVREMLARTRYRVVSDAAAADATLRGTVVLFDAIPQNFDPATGRATSVMTITRLSVSLRDGKDGQELYSNPDLTHREFYEVSADPEAYVDERDAAVLRASRTLAVTLVSAVLSGF